MHCPNSYGTKITENFGNFWYVPNLRVTKNNYFYELQDLFVLKFYGPVNPLGHVERGQFT